MPNKRSNSDPTPSKSSRGAAAFWTATATCSCARCRRRAFTRFPARSSTPMPRSAKLQSAIGKLDPATVAALHDRHSWFVWIARKIPHETAARVRSLNLLGVDLKEEETGLRVDTAGRLASTVLGFVGTDENGLDGVEYAFDSVLRGRSGRIDVGSRRVRTSDSVRPRARRGSGAGGLRRRAHPRPLFAVRCRANARPASFDLPRARRHGHRHGSVDRRDPCARKSS